MQRDAGPTLAVIALAVLAGCSGFVSGDGTPTTEASTETGSTAVAATATATGGGTATDGTATTDGETATDEPTAAGGATATGTDAVTATPAPAETPAADASLPPGVRADGTVNESALALAHFEAANETGWRVDHRNGNRTTVVVHDGETTYRRDADGVAWTSGRREVTNDTLTGTDREFTFRRNASSFGDGASTITFALAVRLGTGNYEWVDSRVVDGATVHELRMTGPKNAGGAVGHYTGTMHVGEDGRIHRLWGEVGDNESAAEAYEYDYAWGVETAPQPPWLDEVPRGVAEKTDDGTALNVTMTGGPAVPAGTEFEFSHNGTYGTVTLDEPLAPGETLYVGVRDAGDGRSAVVASRERPTGDDLVALTGDRTQLRGTADVGDAPAVEVQFVVGQISF